MLIFNKRSSSSNSPHSNKYPQSALVKQDFIEYNGLHNNEEEVVSSLTKSYTSNNCNNLNSTNNNNNNTNSNGNNNSLNDLDTIQMEETSNDCVYQVRIKSPLLF